MRLVSYLNFNGNCAEAFKFYEQLFDGKIEGIMPYSEMPDGGQCSAEMKDWIMHACLSVGDQQLMGSDCPPEMFQKAQGITVSIHVNSPEEAERIFAGLAEGGQVTMPLQETFWAPRFGMATDRFGTPWMVNCSPACPENA